MHKITIKHRRHYIGPPADTHSEYKRVCSCGYETEWFSIYKTWMNSAQFAKVRDANSISMHDELLQITGEQFEVIKENFVWVGNHFGTT